MQKIKLHVLGRFIIIINEMVAWRMWLIFIS